MNAVFSLRPGRDKIYDALRPAFAPRHEVENPLQRLRRQGVDSACRCSSETPRRTSTHATQAQRRP